MLVLSRRVGDAIICATGAGEEIEIKILTVRKSGQVRIGIHAPTDCNIKRSELEVRWRLAASEQAAHVLG